jgi:hypothetical protein
MTNRFRIDMAEASVPFEAIAGYLVRLALANTRFDLNESDLDMVRFEAIAEGSNTASFTAGLMMVTVMEKTLPIVVWTAGEHAGAGTPCEASEALMEHECPEELANQLVIMACRMCPDDNVTDQVDIN